MPREGQPVLVGTVSVEKSRDARAHAQERRACRTTCSTPSITSARRRSSRRPAARARSPSPPTWPAAAPTSCSAATRSCMARESEAGPRSTETEADEAVRSRSYQRAAASSENARKCSRAGGLHILGTERHESRRIDNQLRGRAGRQGDPGSSRFYLSLEDDLMRIFGGDRVKNLMERLGMEEGVPIEHRMVIERIERAQKQVEGRNFDIRKHLLEYDDVMNKQREAIYALRKEILLGERGQGLRPRARRRHRRLRRRHPLRREGRRRRTGTSRRSPPTCSPTSTSHVGEARRDLEETGASRSCASTSRRRSPASTRRRTQRLGADHAAVRARHPAAGHRPAWKDHLLASTTSRKASACAATASATQAGVQEGELRGRSRR